MIEILRKLNSKFLIRRSHKKQLSVDEQKKYLDSFPEPHSYAERSYYQYKCQNKANGILFRLVSNIAAFFLLFGKVIRTIISNPTQNTKGKNKDAIFFVGVLDINYIPYTLKEKYPDIHSAEYVDEFFLDKDDIKYVMRLLKKTPFSYYLIYKLLIKISSYHAQIDNFNPKAIIVSGEYSFTSSLLTDYCEKHGVKHINIQHGEKLFELVDSFCTFHTFYVWDDWYAEVVKSMRAEDSQFVVAKVPVIEEMREKVKELKNSVKQSYALKYYLGGENKADIIELSKIVSSLENNGYSIKIRPHPRYTDMSLLMDTFKEELIEDRTCVSLEESFASAEAIISLKSATLYQAYRCDIITYIDDITNSKKYAELRKQGYIMLEKSRKLSSIIKKESID